MVALPFTHLALRARKPPNPAYPEHLLTLGDHIRQRRLDLGLLQKEVAVRVNATTSTVTNWEKNRTAPRLKFLPKVFEFLNYRSLQDNAPNLSARVKRFRIKNELSLRKMAKLAGVDPASLSRLEKSKSKSFHSTVKKVLTFLDDEILIRQRFLQID